ncbi:hypothetical protein HanXRQr2_Chr08g0338721 [Helianthus annuus]|uniref:Uncharacterized protein n=1 Tax=Helianthus annuus TaxID=4232 RepID=A0A9K3IEY8_HELAN|nr:hypothetical protein HanXRQr2_Chr08g0338721 [Helianthus annuus]
MSTIIEPHVIIKKKIVSKVNFICFDEIRTKLKTYEIELQNPKF